MYKISKIITCSTLLLIKPSKCIQWHMLKQSVSSLWDEKADYIAGELIYHHGINIESIPGLYDFINSNKGCWCQSSDRSEILGHRHSDKYDEICKQYHKCTECGSMKACNFHKNAGNPVNIHIRGHKTFEERASPKGAPIDDLFVSHNKTRLRCNVRDECKHSLCECSRYLYKAFADQLAKDIEEAFGMWNAEQLENFDPNNFMNLDALSPLTYIQAKRIEASDEVCHPKNSPETLKFSNNQPSLDDIFGSDDPSSIAWQRSFQGLDEASSQGIALDWFTSTVAPLLDLTAINDNKIDGSLLIQGRSLSAVPVNNNIENNFPTGHMSTLQKQTARQIFERLVTDYERQANFDVNYIPVYQKLKEDLDQYNSLPTDYTWDQLPETAKEALNMFNNHLSPKDHERDWWMSLVEQDNHANYMKNDECCGELPYWRPYNTENGAKACCGKSGQANSWKTYSIDFFTCCDGETKGNGEGGCLSDIDTDRLQFQSRSFSTGQNTISYVNSKPTGSRLHVYNPFIDEREDNDFEEDEKDSKNFSVLPNTYDQDESVIGTPVYTKTTEEPEQVINFEVEKPSSFDADLAGHELNYDEWARSFRTGGLQPIDNYKSQTIDDFQAFIDNHHSRISEGLSFSDLDTQEIDNIYSAITESETPSIIDEVSDQEEPILIPADVKSPTMLSLRNAGAGDSDMDTSEYWRKDQCLVDIPMAFGKKQHKIDSFCQEKAEKFPNGNPVTGTNLYLYPDRTCRFYIDCNRNKLVNCGQGKRFNGEKCDTEWNYSDQKCGRAMNLHNYGMVFERKASVKSMNRNGQDTSSYMNQLASLNYDDTCIGQNPSDDFYCSTQCGCTSANCKGCTEQDACVERCKYKTEAGYTHKSKKYLFCKHLKPTWSNDNLLWTDWTCKSYVHCQSNENEIRTCPDGEIFSVRDNRCIVIKAGKRCGQWFTSQAKINRNYRPTWNAERCVFSV